MWLSGCGKVCRSEYSQSTGPADNGVGSGCALNYLRRIHESDVLREFLSGGKCGTPVVDILLDNA
jgi:hypothetical protein